MSLAAILAIAIFVAVIIAASLELTDLTVVALVGAMLLILTGQLTMPEAMASIANAHGTLALLFGMMVLVQALEATGAFNGLAHRVVLASRGDGRRLLLGIMLLTSPICAVLPNATTVMLLAPLLPPLAKELKLDPRPLLLLLVLTANSAGLLTLVGDPATYIVATSIGFSFGKYLSQLSLGGLISLLVIVPTLPWLYRSIWTARFTVPDLMPPRPHHRQALRMLLGVTVVMLVLFTVGEMLPVPLSPDATALAGATAALAICHQSRLITVERLFAAIDWSTLVYFMGVFVLIGGLQSSGAMAAIAQGLTTVIGTNVLQGSLLLLLLTGVLSAFIPNIPLVAALTPIMISYCQKAGLTIAGGAIAPQAYPLFFALMFGGTLGGNATLIGASANLVGAGIARQHDTPIHFRDWLPYGVPTVILQLSAALLYCWWRSS